MNEITPFEELADELQARAKHREEETPGDPAAQAIASVIPDDQLGEEYILPSVFNEQVLTTVRTAVAEEAMRTGRPRAKGSRVYI